MSDLEGPTKRQAERIDVLLHAIQTGVAWEHARGSTDGTPKHLRVGINNSLVIGATTARLLVEKGIVTSDEYWETYIAELEREIDAYQSRAPKNVRFQ